MSAFGEGLVNQFFVIFVLVGPVQVAWDVIAMCGIYPCVLFPSGPATAAGQHLLSRSLALLAASYPNMRSVSVIGGTGQPVSFLLK